MPEQKTTRIYLVRHGETTLSAEDRFAGTVEVELSSEGAFQARRLEDRLSDESITTIYSSPQTRTVQNATSLASLQKIPVSPE